jgi:hypothetical protein
VTGAVGRGPVDGVTSPACLERDQPRAGNRTEPVLNWHAHRQGTCAEVPRRKAHKTCCLLSGLCCSSGTASLPPNYSGTA